MTGNNSIYIQDNVIVDLEQDTFGHRHIADAVVDSILSTKPPFTIGIFGGWGTGKSSLLELIKQKLKKENFVTVTIDAWRYSSAENLRRAFLVHVASELAPKLLDDLRRRLYTSEQETLLEKPSTFDSPKLPPREYIFDNVKIFLVLAGIFLGFLFIVYFFRTGIANQWESNFFTKFEWLGFLDKFVDLAFIPFLLTFINYIRLYVIQRPVTVIQERIDADELFSEYFEKVVNEALKSPLSKKILVIFVDNLDRLTDDKMIEALESLKTYLVNKHCVFVVACDDNVVRSVVSNSPKIPKIKEIPTIGGKAGEHYLDKFFQQTFRLPEYMAINLSDYGLKNFETTNLYNKLRSQKIDIRNLVSILLPSDINSPRKVKRLLNEFIALYEIVERRENEKNGQLKPGTLTDNIEFLGKFSTIRSEYPIFYKALTEDSSLINKITDLFQEQDGNEAQCTLNESMEKYSSSFISYLRKTQTILVEDVDPYIWLSQDALTLGLRGNHNNQLRTALSDGDFDQVKSIIDNSDDVGYKALLAKVASRIVEQRLIGIEQQNGVKVLSHLLPIFDDSIKLEIAHACAKLMPPRTIENFSADEVFNVLRWASMGGINVNRKNLVVRILDRLQDHQLRQPTFYAILQNADVIEQNNAADQVNKWLAEILSVDNQMVQLTSEVTDTGPDAIDQNDRNRKNRDFVEWLIALVGDYSGNHLVIQNYYSRDLMDYMVSRLLGKFDNGPAVCLDDAEGVGLNIHNAFNIITTEIENGHGSENYWKGLLQILENSVYIPEIKYSLKEITFLMNYCPPAFVEQFFQNIIISIRNLVEVSEDNQITSEIIDTLHGAENVILLLRDYKGIIFDKKLLVQSAGDLTYLLGNTEISKEIMPFIEIFLERFGKEDSFIFITGIINAFDEYGDNSIIGNLLLDSIIRWDQFVTATQKSDVVGKINQLFVSNEPTQVEIAYQYLAKIIGLEEYKELTRNCVNKWREMFGADEPQLLQKKLDIYNTLIIAGILDTNELINTIIPFIPFTGNQDQLHIVMEEINKILGKVSDDTGTHLFVAFINNIDSFGPFIPMGLRLISRWIERVDEAQRSQFASQAYNAFPAAPKIIMEILQNVWQGLTEAEIQNHIIQFYSVDFDADSQEKRDASVAKGLGILPEEDKVGFICNVWDELINKGRLAEQFMHIAVEFMSLDDLIELREDAITFVRENGATDLSEVNLRFLAVTIRKDVRNTMHMVDLFVNLFGRGQPDVQMALKYVVPCLKPLDIRSEHKYKLAEAMGKVAERTEVREINDEIHDKADELGLKWFKHRKDWK